jgi:hypothetical protein
VRAELDEVRGAADATGNARRQPGERGAIGEDIARLPHRSEAAREALLAAEAALAAQRHATAAGRTRCAGCAVR